MKKQFREKFYPVSGQRYGHTATSLLGCARRTLLRNEGKSAHSRIPYQAWRQYLLSAPLLQPPNPPERARLRRLAAEFLAHKTISGAGGIKLDKAERLHIAAHACLLILRLDLEYYAGFREVIVYPDAFMVEYEEEEDDTGLIHRIRHPLAGEAWEQGPVILAWNEITPDTCPHTSGASIILHEFAHKLDMLSGTANGMPPTRPEISRKHWTRALTAAYQDLRASLEERDSGAIDPYAAENPAEFFAVLTEIFFATPGMLRDHYPDVYKQFCRFYRQDPAARNP